MTTPHPEEHPTEVLPAVGPARSEPEPTDDDPLVDASWQQAARRRSRLTTWLVVLLLVVLAFWAGVTVGRASAGFGPPPTSRALVL